MLINLHVKRHPIQTVQIIIKMTTTTKPKKREFFKAAPLVLLLLSGNQLLAQTSSTKSLPGEGVSVLEILGYVAMIIGVILLAWIIGAAQSKDSPADAPTKPYHQHKHFDHPNDPHFRKLKKKTS